jgi:hypothetical protein
LLFILTVGLAPAARADTSNGNDFALYCSEAKTLQARQALVDDALGRPHFFRYLEIKELDDQPGKGIDITAVEPSSLLTVRFLVIKTESRKLLRSDPVTKVGDAIAVTGVVRGLGTNTIVLNPVIVRHKDRLHPKRGKEMLYEVDPTATYYSYTGGKRPVSLTYQDRDLLEFKDKILSTEGKNGWGEFLERELAKRNAARAEARKKRAPVPAPAPAPEAGSTP